MKAVNTMAGVLACFALAACGPHNSRMDPETQQRLIRENEMRLSSLENSVNQLNSEVEQISNRTYEVRTRGGQKTSMTVVPVSASKAVAPSPAPAATPKAPPVGKKIDPAAKPAVAKKKPAAAPANAAGPSGKLAAAEVALPPADLPAGLPPIAPGQNTEQAAAQNMTPPPVQDSPQSVHGRVDNNSVPVPQGNVPEGAPAVPVPLLPTEDVSLPPEQSPPPQVTQTPAPATPAAPVRRKAQAGEQAAYNSALNAARAGRTAEGIRLFRDFLQKYPSGPYTANAEYWIGECLYAQGKFPEAARQFENVNNSYPSHHKNADALLKAGMTLSKMGDKDAAAAKYRTLLANFPNSEAARRARAMGAR